MSKAYIEYSSNNSGGSWWLTDENWKDLQAAGWEVDWYKDSPSMKQWADAPDSGRFLGALASCARRYGVSMKMAITEWEDITGQYASDQGCSCCGVPHSFYGYDENGKMIW